MKRHGWCKHCGKAILYDADGGFWIHEGFGKVDGHNGLYCEPGMWDGSVPRVYPEPLDGLLMPGESPRQGRDRINGFRGD